MINRFLVKAVTIILSIVLLVPGSLLFYPAPAQAAATNCAAVVAGAIASIAPLAAVEKTLGVTTSQPSNASGLAVSAGSGYGQFFKDCVLTPIAIKLAKAMLQNITSSIVNWINSGFHGNPSFVQNLNGLVSDTIDQGIGQFISDDLGGNFLCSSFSFQVKAAIAQSYLPYHQRAACSLSQITNNVNNFANNNGGVGWDNWLQVTTEPQNNVYGATILAQNELSQQIANKLNVQNRVLDWGKGFRSWDVCTKSSDGSDPSKLDPTDKKCKGTETHTPGTVVETQLETSLGSGVRQLEVANDIDAIVGALTNQLMSKVITGAKGLLGAGQSSSGSNYNSTTYQSAINTQTSDAALSSAINTGIDQISQDSNLDTVFNTAVGTSTPTVATQPDQTQQVDEQGNPIQTNSLNWALQTSTPVVNANTTLDYRLNLESNYSATGLTVTMTLRKDGKVAPFLSAFSSFSISYGRSDGTIATKYVSSQTDGSAVWSNVSADPNAPFLFRIAGTKNTSAPLGTYTLETAVSDSSGKALQVETDTFTMQ
ncbi:MAG TPA: hypothetical protein VFT82_01930 [Candidatus Paceibacterota bacterium]|nr:hypothetical protein [Candidatus Paceibacterota bacterium]